MAPLPGQAKRREIRRQKITIKKYLKKAANAVMKAAVHPTPGRKFIGEMMDVDTNSGVRPLGLGLGRNMGDTSTISKLKKGKTFKRKKKDKNPSISQLHKRGITLNYEYRKTATGEEALAIGHTSMPGKVCAMNMWRAMLKAFLLQIGIIIKDYGNRMQNSGFLIGDQFTVTRFANGTSTGTTLFTVTIVDELSYDGLAHNFANEFDDLNNLQDDRLESFVFNPSASSHIPYSVMDLSVLKITVYTKSALKLQNVTVENAGDNETDDITRVPLSGYIYGMKGNNFCMKSNKNLLDGFFNVFNEEAIFSSYSRQQPTTFGPTGTIGFYGAGAANNNQTTFYKPAEPPKVYELQNCESRNQLVLGPGQIKNSVITQKFTVSLQYYFNLLYSKHNTSNSLLIYNPQQGKTNVIYVEKEVGRAANATNQINIWVELELKQSVLVHGSASKMTLPIQFQNNF